MPKTPSALTPSTIALLTLPPLLWAGNAVVGRIAAAWIPPVTFNLPRRVIAALLLLPMTPWVDHRDSPLWRRSCHAIMICVALIQ